MRAAKKCWHRMPGACRCTEEALIKGLASIAGMDKEWLFQAKDRVRIKSEWDEGLKEGTVLGLSVFTKNEWTPVLWDGEEDPDFQKTASLEPVPASRRRRP